MLHQAILREKMRSVRLRAVCARATRAEMEEKNDAGWTPLMTACRYRPDLVEVLLEYEADVRCQNASGTTALHAVCLAEMEDPSRLKPELRRLRVGVYNELHSRGANDTIYSCEFACAARQMCIAMFFVRDFAPVAWSTPENSVLAQ